MAYGQAHGNRTRTDARTTPSIPHQTADSGGRAADEGRHQRRRLHPTQAVLVLNAGSSSIKFALFDAQPTGPALRCRGQVQSIGAEACLCVYDAAGVVLEQQRAGCIDHARALDLLLDWLATNGALGSVIGIGHRVVHGGATRSAPLIIDSDVLNELEALEPLAPLHQPRNVAVIRRTGRRLPGVPQIACFDTAFHACQPAVARRLGLPREFEDRGLRRYGFHGISYEYIVASYTQVTGEPLPQRLIIAHLGSGASLCAVREGRSIATTMGFSTLDGLVMGTRPGLLDPGVLLHLLTTERMNAEDLSRLLYHRSGLLGVSGESADMRALLASDKPGAKDAIEFYCYRAVREIGSLVAALGGLDALVFTGGIGENAPLIRRRIATDLAWLGLVFDDGANAANGPRLSSPGSPVACSVIPTNEELMIARSTLRLVADTAG